MIDLIYKMQHNQFNLNRMIMKRFNLKLVSQFTALAFSLLLCNSCGLLDSVYEDGLDYGTSFAVNGRWADWQGMSLKYFGLHGNYSDIAIIVNSKPWVTVCHFHINQSINMNKTTEWESYSGYIEYYVSDQYPTIYSQLTSNRYKFYTITDLDDALAYLPFAVTSETNGAVKRTANATIKIAPHKKNKPQTYNIHFDGVAIGLDLRNLKWN